jgi:hypothetical protein
VLGGEGLGDGAGAGLGVRAGAGLGAGPVEGPGSARSGEVGTAVHVQRRADPYGTATTVLQDPCRTLPVRTREQASTTDPRMSADCNPGPQHCIGADAHPVHLKTVEQATPLQRMRPVERWRPLRDRLGERDWLVGGRVTKGERLDSDRFD